jgi:secreted PhoX family phosphatase
MTPVGISRRGFIGGTAGAGVVLVIGAQRSAAQAIPDGPYGQLASQPDPNGLLLPDGFSSRVVARAGENVEGTGYEWPAFPDGAATFPIEAGGWYHVVNSEIPTPGNGGASAIQYDADGNVVDAYRVLGDTTQNCAGGPTPWGTWLSCEETDGGQVWECDPTRPGSGVARPAMGAFHHEAAAVDPDNQVVYLTEDEPDGAFYRFTPTAYPDLAEGVLEVASVDPDGVVSWYEVTDPSAATERTALQVPEVTHFDGGEGCWFADGTVWFTTKNDNHVRSYDAATETMAVVYDGNGLLNGVDNVTVENGSGDLYVAEDGDDMQLVVITSEGDVVPVAQVVGEELPPNDPIPSEITGPVFSPDGSRLYFSSQRGGNPQTGVTYEITGPFRGIEAAEPSTTTTVAAAQIDEADTATDTVTDEDDGSSPAVPIAIGVGAVAVVAAGAVALRRRGARGPSDDPDPPAA